MEQPSILIIDDEADLQTTLKSVLKSKYRATAVSSGLEGLSELKNHAFDLVISDIKMPVMDGLEVLKKIKEMDPTLPVVMLTASQEIKSAVEAMRAGAEDYLSKPFDKDELLAVIEKVLEKRDLQKENRALREIVREAGTYCDLIGKSEKMQKLIELIDRIAPTDSTVLISGESGTGKEIAAKAIHKMSQRKNLPLISLNCAAIPENLLESELFGHERGAFTGALDRRIGKFELADKGTIFLDEIGCMSPAMQSKLLRVLEERAIERVGGNTQIKVDVRIISATNINFQKEIADGKFREDLYYRLNVIPIEMPPLRERKEDLPYFISYFIDKFNKEMNRKIKGLTNGAEKILSSYSYPGNVREFKNIIERAVALASGDLIEEDNLGILGTPSALSKTRSLKETCDDFERSYIMQILKETGGNKTEACKIMNIARTTLASKMDSLGLS